jgi:DNA-binding beta-propeller fold protein YncE
MKRIAATLLLAAVFLAMAMVKNGRAEMEWEVKDTLQINKNITDLAVSSDGKYFYVLTDDGKVTVYNGIGQKQDSLDVGKSVNRIEVSPDGSLLYLADGSAKTVRIAEVSYMAHIDVTGDPFKGPANAPVTIVLYSDFQ